MDISVVIVNYRSKIKLINCLESLDKSDWSDLSYEIIVVENNSGDSLDGLIHVYKNVKLIISEKNLGMGGGNNLGITQSSGEYILIANPDLIFKEGAILEMYQYLKHNLEAAMVGPKLLNPDASLQYSCARFPNIFLPLFRRTAFGRYFPSFSNKYLMKKDDYSCIKEVDWLLGACLLVRRGELFINGKLFDERFFMYFEDVDLGKRTRLLNKKTVYLPGAEVIHDHMRSSARLPWYKAIFFDKLAREHLRSWFRYFKKWYFN
jgi:GT2 family glycosyltransferase